jgi:transcriptional regulator GlxA family with amidase domain
MSASIPQQLLVKRLLADTGITVAECARRTGFDDPANFSKFFRARAGIAPGEFAVRAGGSADRAAHPVMQGEA